MRDYAMFALTSWTRGVCKMLRGDAHAQLLAVYVSTAPTSHSSGLYYAPLATTAFELGLAVDVVRIAFARLDEIEFAHFDEADGLIWVPMMAELEFPKKMVPADKRVIALRRHLEQLGDHRFVRAFRDRYGVAFHLQEGGPAPLPKAPPTPLPREPHGSLRSQDQDQDPDQDQEFPEAPPFVEAPPSVPIIHADPVPSPHEGITPITSNGVTLDMGVVYAEVVRAKLGSFGLEYEVDRALARAINAHAPAGLTGDELRARLRFSVGRFIDQNRETAKFNSWAQPKHWAHWLNNENGWTLSRASKVVKPYEPTPASMPKEPPMTQAERIAAAEKTLAAMDAICSYVPRPGPGAPRFDSASPVDESVRAELEAMLDAEDEG